MSGKLLSVDRGERIRDDRAHGSLLILNELLRCSNAPWERKYMFLQENTDPKPAADGDHFSFNRPPFMYSIHAKKKSNTNIISALASDKPVIIESSICHQLVAEKFEYICIDVLAQR